MSWARARSVRQRLAGAAAAAIVLVVAALGGFASAPAGPGADGQLGVTFVMGDVDVARLENLRVSEEAPGGGGGGGGGGVPYRYLVSRVRVTVHGTQPVPSICAFVNVTGTVTEQRDRSIVAGSDQATATRVLATAGTEAYMTSPRFNPELPTEALLSWPVPRDVTIPDVVTMQFTSQEQHGDAWNCVPDVVVADITVPVRR